MKSLLFAAGLSLAAGLAHAVPPGAPALAQLKVEKLQVPEPGKVVAHIALTNTAAQPRSLDKLKLYGRDDLGRRLTPGLMDRELTQGTLQPGATLNGAVGFELERGRRLDSVEIGSWPAAS
ncbi:DUF4352 domain-containing protein [Neisseriaceae bacterium JH1-16]|nr:DUF4352 domain-containing protein [Neisseriaceae bacterium JH1-16]